MERVLAVEFMDENEYVVYSDRENEEGNDFCNNERHAHAKEGEDSDTSRNRCKDKEDPEETKGEFGACKKRSNASILGATEETAHVRCSTFAQGQSNVEEHNKVGEDNDLYKC
jgi:hypothetical protein